MMQKFSRVVVVALSVIALAGARPEIPAWAEKAYQRAMKEAKPKHLTWIQKTASTVAAEKLTKVKIREMAKAHSADSGLSEADIDGLIFLVMMRVWKNAKEDLQRIIDELERLKNLKEKIRQMQEEMKQYADLTEEQLASIRALAEWDQTTEPTAETLSAQLAQKLQETNQTYDKQYLLLQQIIQDESRRYTIISNILKTKRDTVENSINNIR